MTINAPASLLLLLYELVAEEQGVGPEALSGTIQNDILKEYIARGNYIFPARPSMRLTVDTFRYCTERLPRWNTISILGYHIREAGSTRRRSSPSRSPTASPTCRRRSTPGSRSTRSRAGCRSSSTPTTTSSPRWRSSGRRGCSGPRSCATGSAPRDQRDRCSGSTPRPVAPPSRRSRPRITLSAWLVQALSAVCGGAQSLHTNGYDEALALPTERAATIGSAHSRSLRTEAGAYGHDRPAGRELLHRGADRPAGRRGPGTLIDEIDRLGGAVAAVDSGWVQ